MAEKTDVDKLEDRAREIRELMANSNDYFFIYGWQKELEQIEDKITAIREQRIFNGSHLNQ